MVSRHSFITFTAASTVWEIIVSRSQLDMPTTTSEVLLFADLVDIQLALNGMLVQKHSTSCFTGSTNTTWNVITIISQFSIQKMKIIIILLSHRQWYSVFSSIIVTPVVWVHGWSGNIQCQLAQSLQTTTTFNGKQTALLLLTAARLQCQWCWNVGVDFPQSWRWPLLAPGLPIQQRKEPSWY